MTSESLAVRAKQLHVIRNRGLALQVCAPESWTEEEVNEATNSVHPTGIRSTWRVVDPMNGDARRVVCEEGCGRVHYVMVC